MKSNDSEKDWDLKTGWDSPRLSSYQANNVQKNRPLFVFFAFTDFNKMCSKCKVHLLLLLLLLNIRSRSVKRTNKNSFKPSEEFGATNTYLLFPDWKCDKLKGFFTGKQQRIEVFQLHASIMTFIGNSLLWRDNT